MDINSALEALKGLDNSACSVVKHNNPCGLASGENQKDIIAYAWGGDSISAFGSIIAFNRPLELETAKFFQLDHENKSMRKFIEVIIAPAFSPEALTYLQQHKNLRIIRFDGQQLNQTLDYRFLNGSLLVQDTDQILMQDAKSVTGQNFDLDAHQDLVRFGLSAIRAIKSNSIVLVRRINNHLQLLGMGAGQPNRLIATKLAIDKAKENLKDLSEEERKEQLSAAVMVSDAFFPFEDNVELAAAEGIRNIVQPGGSIRDPQIIETCNRYQIAMIFTGIRHFKH
jgi:phosphoribosylaminoimidazolecarboxamide formyltransferase/IMP cyclohydrolase